jgi:DNA-binding NarL/FixJ family response regulator
MGLEDHHAAQEPSRIVVADDHPLFRFAIRQTLEVQPDLEVIAEAADGQEALELSRRLRPELILMDLRMPVMDGVAATQAIRRELPETFVLILTALDESEGLSDSLQAGAAGYVLKDAPAPRIADAVLRTLAGENPLNEKVAMRLLTSLMNGKAKQENATEQREGPRFRKASWGDRGIATRQPPYASRGGGHDAGGARTYQPADSPHPLDQREHR